MKDYIVDIIREAADKKRVDCIKCGKSTFWFFKKEEVPLCRSCKNER